MINAGDDELLFAGGGADPFFGPADGGTLGCPLGMPGDPLGVGNALPAVGEDCSWLYQTILRIKIDRFDNGFLLLSYH